MGMLDCLITEGFGWLRGLEFETPDNVIKLYKT